MNTHSSIVRTISEIVLVITTLLVPWLASAQEASSREEAFPHIGVWGGLAVTTTSGYYQRDGDYVLTDAAGPGGLVRFSYDAPVGERWSLLGYELNAGVIVRTIAQTYDAVSPVDVLAAADSAVHWVNVPTHNQLNGTFLAATLGASVRLNPVNGLHIGVGFDYQIPIYSRLFHEQRLESGTAYIPDVGSSDVALVGHAAGGPLMRERTNTRIAEEILPQFYYTMFMGLDFPLSDRLSGRGRLQIAIPRDDAFTASRFAFNSIDVLAGVRWRL